ncbi:hypothetical protein ACH42_17545 [Endozoicomonas sp. (ex Bugula neritina AB1)]|nr:hypothetical protein ACH42_17545 [Endozoicomonas sp. (ex Bugula neritina AB1)]
MLHIALPLCFLAGLMFSAPKLWNWINRPIARVEVHAPFKNLEQGRIEEELAYYLQVGFFQLDLKAMQKDLLAMPWVDSVSVRRAWPVRLLVNIEERQAIARWGDGQLISTEGKVFAPQDVSGFLSLPLLVGPDNEAEQVMQQYLAISQLLRPIGLGIDRLELSETGAWSFTVEHVSINMGRDRKMERLQRFIRLYYARLQSRWSEVARIDLRYLNGASVAWNQGEQEL